MIGSTNLILEDCEDDVIEYTNVSLYLGGIQTVFATCAVACVSVLSCWVIPAGAVSAVRTLTVCIGTGLALTRKPLRVGKVHGVGVVFTALRPCVLIYLACLVSEQLVHTCVASDALDSPSWRRVVFHGMVLAMLFSGFMRARRPSAETDMPLLITSAALLVVAVLPPPAVALSGPLCEPVGAWVAAERVVRAFAFSTVYSVFVYASAPPSRSSGEILICVTRATASSVWTLGCSPVLLLLGIVQCLTVVLTRIKESETHSYKIVSQSRPDAEAGTPTTHAFPSPSPPPQ